MAKKQKVVEMPAAVAVPEVPEVLVEQAEACPTYTLRADELFGLRAMIAIAAAGHLWGATEEKLRELEVAVREFELFEAAHRG
jgi:hypothetical protein